MRSALKRTKKHTGTAWAVVDAKRPGVGIWDLEDTKRRAVKLRTARRNIFAPIHADAEWTIVRVSIKSI